jgi:hypothetical protein
MNSELIRQLSETAKSRVPAGLEVDAWIDRYIEALVELVIQECIDIIPWEYEAEIKQHFGVEE